MRERDYNNLTILLGNCTKIACIDKHDVDKTQKSYCSRYLFPIKDASIDKACLFLAAYKRSRSNQGQD